MNLVLKSWHRFVDLWLHNSAKHFLHAVFLCHIAQLPLCLFLDSRPLAYLNAASAVIYLLLFLLENHQPCLAVIFSELEIILFSLIASALAGFYSGFFLYLICLLAISAFLGDSVENTPTLLALVLDLEAIIVLVCVQKNIPLQIPGITPLRGRDLTVLFVWNLVVCVSTIILSVQLTSQALRRRNHELESANLHLEYLASHDPLTGLQNRRNIHELLEDLCQESHVKKTQFCLAMADVDDFKNFNDQYGHCHGDLVLTLLADCIRSCIREGDIICRWGGEEIMILFMNTPKDAARDILLRIQAQLHNLNCKPDSPLPHAVTLTFGLAEYASGQTPHELVSEADRLLYQGKLSGKNCVMG